MLHSPRLRSVMVSCSRPRTDPGWSGRWMAPSPRWSSQAWGIGAAKASGWSKRSIEGEADMSSTRDKAGRPIVVATGLGVVTSIGAGKTENWNNLTKGTSGIHNITRFETDGLKTRIAGTVDFVPVTPLSTPALSERLADMAAEEAISQSGIGSKGNFPGPLFLAVPPIEMEWPQRRELAEASGANDAVSYSDLLRAAESGDFQNYH